MRKIVAALSLAFLAGAVGATQQNTQITSFETPIDALSIHIEKTETAEVRAKTETGWSEWQKFEIDDEQDPNLLESNLVMFPESITEIQIRGDVSASDLHPITVSKEPARYSVAATGNTSAPRILTRSDWGADESILYKAPAIAPPVEAAGDKDSNGPATTTEISQREKNCIEAQVNYPQDFKTVNRKTKGANGQTLRWANVYSPSIKLLVVHHTAVSTAGDTRSGVERIRALYAYHANSRGWGDVGYHYLIDSDGKIYEGKSGGPMVVAGHAYCNNTGTIGIAMLGNFDNEEPTQEQVKSLQWLLDDVADMYDIDVSKQVSYHGVKQSPIVGHRDLLSTACPGYFMYGALDQVRKNVINGDLSAEVTFPPPRSISVSSKPYVDRSGERRNQRGGAGTIQSGITPLGSTALTGRPGDSTVFTVRYLAGDTSVNRRTAIADITATDPTLTLWQEIDGQFIKVRDQILLPQTLAANGTVQIRLKADLPINAGTSELRIGQTVFVVTTKGRRQLGARGQEVIPDSVLRSQARAAQRKSSLSPLPSTRPSTPISSASFASSASYVPSSSSPLVRIRLSSREKGETTCSAVDLNALQSLYRGKLECRVFNGQAAIINELPLEDYLMGLAEEPDTELYEKQRAFAIAARTYAAYYLSPDHRKVPGAPYDGTDSPAVFQKYNGISFELKNPNWVKAVASTSSQVLMKNNQIIKPPYFSSDDGRTRTPEEAGWKNFPFAEVFSSKEDPWCNGLKMAGHGVGMSGCGAKGQAKEGKTGEEILSYYYPGTTISTLTR